MKKCDVGFVFVFGDCVVYVMVKGVIGFKNFECFEDFIYVFEYNVFIDIKYYFDNQFVKFFGCIFEFIFGEIKVKFLLIGDYICVIFVVVFKVGGFMKFVKKI